MWESGNLTLGGIPYEWEAKVQDKPNHHGIYSGRISKLYIIEKDPCLMEPNKDVVVYDRAWVLEPKTDTHKTVYQHVLSVIEGRHTKD